MFCAQVTVFLTVCLTRGALAGPFFSWRARLRTQQHVGLGPLCRTLRRTLSGTTFLGLCFHFQVGTALEDFFSEEKNREGWHCRVASPSTFFATRVRGNLVPAAASKAPLVICVKHRCFTRPRDCCHGTLCTWIVSRVVWGGLEHPVAHNTLCVVISWCYLHF